MTPSAAMQTKSLDTGTRTLTMRRNRMILISGMPNPSQRSTQHKSSAGFPGPKQGRGIKLGGDQRRRCIGGSNPQTEQATRRVNSR